MAFLIARSLVKFPMFKRSPTIFYRQCSQSNECRSSCEDQTQTPVDEIREIIGDREIVGFGKNGNFMYRDDVSFPFPAIRFQETTPEILCLREKEKGDWRNLSIEEKKCLYRASFCQTFAEVTAPSGRWKSIVGIAFMFISFGIWFYLFFKSLYPVALPESFQEKNQKMQLKRILTLEINPITGISSKWDYEKEKWK